MKDPYSQTPLDQQETAEEPTFVQDRSKRVWFYLEWIPIALFSLGIFLRYQGNEYWKYGIMSGGITAVLIYLLFSIILLKAHKNSRLQMLLSVLSGFLLAFGVFSLAATYFYWDNAETLIRTTLYSGFAMIFFVALAFLVHIREAQSSRFYRNLLARLFIFIALVYSLCF